jgi:hypothetical protein
MYSQKDWLLIFGAGLFLLGLVTGFVGPLARSIRGWDCPRIWRA